MKANLKEVWKWFLIIFVAPLAAIPALAIIILFTVLFMGYRLVTWPFRLARRWLR